MLCAAAAELTAATTRLAMTVRISTPRPWRRSPAHPRCLGRRSRPHAGPDAPGSSGPHRLRGRPGNCRARLSAERASAARPTRMPPPRHPRHQRRAGCATPAGSSGDRLRPRTPWRCMARIRRWLRCARCCFGAPSGGAPRDMSNDLGPKAIPPDHPQRWSQPRGRSAPMPDRTGISIAQHPMLRVAPLPS